MPTGLPDWTTSADIVAQTIEHLAIDIEAQTLDKLDINLAASDITLDINIKTSAITLNVDITAQTVGNLSVNIAASAVTLTVTATNLSIDIDAQSVGVSNQAEWQSQAVKWMTVKGSGAVANITNTKLINYTVTAGKTFYVYAITCSLSTAIAPTFQVSMTLYTNTIIRLDVGSGTANPQLIIPVPIRVAAGTKIEVYLWHSQGASQNFYVTVLGYEA